MRRKTGWIALVVACLVAVSVRYGEAQSRGQADEKPYVLGIVAIAATDFANARFIKGAKQVAEEKNWQVVVIDAHGSADQANAAMQNFVQRRVDAILTCEFAPSSLGSGLLAARQAKIPVGTWGGGLAPGVVATVGSGGLIARPVVEKMLQDLGEQGSVLALTYRADVVCREREQMFDAIMADVPAIKVRKGDVGNLGYLQAGAQHAAAWLAAHPADTGNLAIWGCWETPVLGAISVLKQQERDDVKTYGLNGSPAALEEIKKGWLTATVWENAVEEGKALAEVVVNAITAGDSWQPKELSVPGELVDANNLAEFLEQHPELSKQ
jgi:ribose transport system substrate-binding protein